jgi:Domain of unknown function (DUF4864)
MRRLLLVLASVMALLSPAWAQSLSDSDRSAFQSVIEGQLQAFQTDDGAKAYGFAAPMIRQIFPNPDVFMSMVRKGYQPVYRPQSYKFGDAGFSASGRSIQKLTVVGPDGLTYEAIYTMEQQPDGSWQINGCALVRAPELGA